jgi:hypothetical protein
MRIQSTVIRRIIITLSALTAAVGIWGFLIEPRLIEEARLEVAVPNLPGPWEGRTIALITDLQVGMFMDNESTVVRAVEKIIAGRPSAVLIGGDFIYHPTEREETREEIREEFEEEYEEEGRRETLETIEQVAGMLEPLTSAGLPVHGVFGNHDYAMESGKSLKLSWVAAELALTLDEIGVRILHNESTRLMLPDMQGENQEGTLILVGIGPYYPEEFDVHKAFAAVPEDAPRIVLLHNPEVFAYITAGRAPIALAGHTHGGQIRIPFLRSWSWLSIVMEGEVHSDGWIRDYGGPGNNLYVNRGIGFSLLPLRLNCPPEITWVTLVSE